MLYLFCLIVFSLTIGCRYDSTQDYTRAAEQVMQTCADANLSVELPPQYKSLALNGEVVVNKTQRSCKILFPTTSANPNNFRGKLWTSAPLGDVKTCVFYMPDKGGLSNNWVKVEVKIDPNPNSTRLYECYRNVD